MVPTVDLPFEYRPLEVSRHIRTLHIHSGLPEDPLLCHLEHVDLDLNPTYEAISYVWGDPSFSRSILCDGKSIAVTQSLNVVLQRLRLRDQQRTVWIDGVCINQSDVKEREHQVRLMGDVYKSAQRVVIWLGRDESGHAKDAFEFCANVAKKHAMDLRASHNDFLNSLSLTEQSSLRALSQCAWFQRTWVLQELILAPSAVVMWGSIEISWDDIGSTIAIVTRFITDAYLTIGKELTKIETFLEMKVQSDTSSISFLRALRWTQGLHCVDKRDKIFALIGLLSGSRHDATTQLAKIIRPSYDISVAQVYEDFAIAAATLDMAGDLITSVRHGSNLDIWTEESIPSWVPDWRRIPKRGRSNWEFQTLFDRFNHGTNLLISPENPFLTSSSLHFSKVRAVSEEVDHRDIEACFHAIADFWQQHVRFHLEHESLDPTSKSIYIRFTEAINEDIDSFDSTFLGSDAMALWEIFKDVPLTNDQRSERRDAAQALLGMWRGQSDTAGRIRTKAYLDDALRELLLPDGQRLFITNTEHIGLGPAAMRPGDDIKFLPRTSAPMVLRSQDNFHQLVGACYVAGLMDLDSDDLADVCKTLDVEQVEIR